ncbi:MAG: flagellar hook-basal body complex protein [Synergistaceae bacterium]|nr:flagellar hook-basal body complex protein [Synergistaceae bacterium]
MTHEGEFALGLGGRINVGEVGQIFVDETGQVLADGEVVGQFQVVEFASPTYLRQAGRSLLSETPESGAPALVPAPQIVGGALERSNVNVVNEMVRMIEANRAYEAAGRTVTIQDELTSRLFSAVGRPTS